MMQAKKITNHSISYETKSWNTICCGVLVY